MSEVSKHYDTEAEQGLIGSLLQEPHYIRRIPFIKKEDFFDPDCEKVFTIFTEMGIGDLGGEVTPYKYNEFVEMAPSAEMIVGFAKVVKENSLKRKMIQVFDTVDIKPTNEIIDEIKSLERELPFATEYHEPYTLNQYGEDVKKTPEGLETGYRDIDKYLKIPMTGITIVAGRPSHGKTTFLLNVCLRMVERYSDKVFFFYSYEDHRMEITTRILNTLSGKILDKPSYQNNYQLKRYIKEGSTHIEEIENAKGKLQELTGEKRLWIIDKPYDVEDLVKMIANDYDRYKIGAVFIDWLQRIGTQKNYQTRQLELQNILRQITSISNELSIPTILGCQFRRAEGNETEKNTVKLDNLREAGDIEQDAKIVLGLWNTAMNRDKNQESIYDEIADLKVHVLKNREGPVNKEATLKFNAPILKIEDAPQ